MKGSNDRDRPKARFLHPAVPARRGARVRGTWPFDLYRSAIGKKYVMAVTGLVLMGYVLTHMVGNLKLYLGRDSINRYGEFLRTAGEPVLARETLLWGLRGVLIVSFVLHIHAAYSLTRMNRRARPQAYAAKRRWHASDFASRTMRWTGVIVGLFVVFHLMDLTWGTVHPDHVARDVYRNTVVSFQRVPVALVYIAANVALGIHLYHGAWSLFQTMGWSSTRVNPWRRYFAIVFAVIVAAGNITFPVAVLSGLVS